MNAPFRSRVSQQGGLPVMGSQPGDRSPAFGGSHGLSAMSDRMGNHTPGLHGDRGLPAMGSNMGNYTARPGGGHGLPAMGNAAPAQGMAGGFPSMRNLSMAIPQPQAGSHLSPVMGHQSTSQLSPKMGDHKEGSSQDLGFGARRPSLTRSQNQNLLPSGSPSMNYSYGLPSADSIGHSQQTAYHGYADRRPSAVGVNQQTPSNSNTDAHGRLLPPAGQYDIKPTGDRHGSISRLGQYSMGEQSGHPPQAGSRFKQHPSSSVTSSIDPPQTSQPNSRPPSASYARRHSRMSNHSSRPSSGNEASSQVSYPGHSPALDSQHADVSHLSQEKRLSSRPTSASSNKEQAGSNSNSGPGSASQTRALSSPASRSRPPSAGRRPSSASRCNGSSPSTSRPNSRPSSAGRASEQRTSDKRQSSSLVRSFSLNRADRLKKHLVTSSGPDARGPCKSTAGRPEPALTQSFVSETSSSMDEKQPTYPRDLVMEVEGGLVVGGRIVINECATTVDDDVGASQDNALDDALGTRISFASTKQDEFQTTKATSCHDMSHHNADMRLNARKWPWERNGNQDNDEMDAEEAALFSNKELYRKFKPKRRRPVNQSLQLQKFVYQDGFIVCQYNQNLVLGMEESEGRSAEVVLVRRRPDDISQRWTIKDNGIIQSKHNPQLVMTVSLPTPNAREEFGVLADMTYIGCQVILKNKKVTQFGRANQRWYYDEGSGFIGAFHTDNIDKEITAAIKANVCTFAVMGRTEIDQPGYSVEMPVEKGRKTKKVTVCSACARAMRGRFKLERIQGQVDFACAMGYAKELQVKQIGSFKCLNGKVDLSTNEAGHTLEEWELQLERLRDELSVRTIAKEIAAARVPYTVKVLAHRNGDGRMKPGEMIVGSSIPGILEQCASRLGLTAAARAMFTADGTQVIDLDELVDWMREQYVERARDDLQSKAQAKQAAKTGDAAKESLISKVDPEEWTDDEDDESPPAEDQINLDEMVHYGFDASTSRTVAKNYQSESYTEILPASMMITSAGKVVVWRVYVSGIGPPLYMQIYRQSEDDARSFQLVGEVELVAKDPGYYVVDVSNQLAQQVTQEGLAAGESIPVKVKGNMLVRKDDVLGFHQPAGTYVLPYDEEPQSEPALCLYGQPHVQPGQLISFPGELTVQRERQYSFNASVAPVIPGRTQSPVNKKDTKKKKKRKGPHIDPPPVDMVLRYPIEVWVTCGEQFIQPERVSRQHEQTVAMREACAAVSYELDKEKHILRQMQGRRLDELNPGKYQSTMNPASPVLIEGHWQDPSVDEQVKHDTVHKLQTHLSEVKSTQKPKVTKTIVDPSRPLYTQPVMKRVLVFPNGESVTRAVYVWGENMAQLLDNSTTRLNLRKQAVYMFSMNGDLLTNIADIDRDQLVCVSPSKTFLRPKESQQTVEVKANWGRARKQYGPEATDIMVKANPNPAIDVDAFGPSEIAGYRP